MTLMPAMPVIELRPGDVITNDEGDVLVESTETVVGGADLGYVNLIRVYGRITRGYGASSKPQRWTYRRDQRLDIERVT